MARSNYDIIIVGGSIAGLTLAHCLHRLNIDFVVLEKRERIAPQEGASVGIMPNGARILEQIGLYSAVEKLIHPLKSATISYPDKFVFTSNFPDLLHQRFGYPLAFLDRQQLLHLLYSSLPTKERVKVNQEAVLVVQKDTKVQVYTKDGSYYTGDLVVGADGVHSKIRAEMWRLAASSESAADRHLTPEAQYYSTIVRYACIFGISHSHPKLKAGMQITTCNHLWSILGVIGKNDRIYWFLFLKLRRKHQYPDCPRFSPNDAANHCEKLKFHAFWRDVQFGEVWERREVFNMVPLEEFIFTRWHFDNIVCIGDSMHKIPPHTGQGANCAIEDAAALSNVLSRCFQAKYRNRWSSQNLEASLKSFTKERVERMRQVSKLAQSAMHIQALDGPLHRFIARYCFPYAGDAPADHLSSSIADGNVLQFVSLPARSGPGWARFKVKNKAPSYWLFACLVLLMILVLYLGV